MSVLAATVAQMFDRDGDHMDWGDGGWWMVGLMFFFGLALVAVVVWAIIASTRSNPQSQVTAPIATPPEPRGPSAREILDQRFAGGEIDAAEYAERKQLLGS